MSERTLVAHPGSDDVFQEISLQQLENGERWVKHTSDGPSFQGRHPVSHSSTFRSFVAVNLKTGSYRSFRYKDDLNNDPRIQAYVREVLANRVPAHAAVIEKPRPSLWAPAGARHGRGDRKTCEQLF